MIKLTTLPSALYVVAMPIGQWTDLSPRAIDVLDRVDVILAEDTRVSGQILKFVNVSTRMVSLNAHSEAGKADRVIESLESGQSLALISDAGTPGISDPGRLLVEKVVEKGFQVIPVPGPSALTAALSVSGFPAAPSHFFGFLSTKSSAREQELERALSYDGTLIFYEAPHRIVDFAERLDRTACGRKVVFARELTKIHEQLIRVVCRTVRGLVCGQFRSDPRRICCPGGAGSADRTNRVLMRIRFFVYLLVHYHHQKRPHWRLSSLECRNESYIAN